MSSPVQKSLNGKLQRPTHTRLKREWAKAQSRLRSDPDGAVTAARTFLESTCKHALEITGKTYERNWDLPKIYSEVSKELGISVAGGVDDLHRKFFGAAHTAVHSISEMRNRVGDAHGKGLKVILPSRADAELAVNLSGSIANYILKTLDGYVAAKMQISSDGKAILKFDKATVWRLVDHAAHSHEHYSSMSQEVTEPALWLVGDAGVYLMSNGKPALLSDGSLLRADAPEFAPRLTAHAEGCNSTDDIDHWWPIHNTIDGGNDFCLAVELDYFRRALKVASSNIVLKAGQDTVSVYSDGEFLEISGV